MDMNKRFFAVIDDKDESNVLGGEISGDNVYLRVYPKVIDGKPLSELEVGESSICRYNLSGSSGVYRVKRTR